MFASKTSWRCLQDMSSRYLQDMSSRRLQDMSSRRLQDMSSRRLQRNNFSSSKTSWRRLQEVSRRLARGLENDFKTSWRRLGRRKTVTLKTYWIRLRDMFWRRLQDVLKTSKCFLELSIIGNSRGFFFYVLPKLYPNVVVLFITATKVYFYGI